MEHAFETDDLRNHTKFRRLFTQKDHLGEGGDGIVYTYEHNTSKKLIAVKTPHAYSSREQTFKAVKHFQTEIDNLTILGQHKHIAGMLAWSYIPLKPAIFLPYCELGDLNNYVVSWKNQQEKQRKHINRVSEVTIWKCLRDMALALYYLHNEQKDSGYVHNDMKPDNILVDLPNGWNPKDGIPDEPIFKLTDFARMTQYAPPPNDAQPSYFLGTPEYAPPFSEQNGRRPSGDIWALGATLQTLALGLFPTQSHEAFSASRKKEGQPVPLLTDEAAWKGPVWRYLIPTTFRPLSATQEELIKEFDVQESIVIDDFYPNRAWEHRPYSRQLDGWYEMLWEVDEGKRITAKSLVRYWVEGYAKKVRFVREMEMTDECFERAKALREEVERKRQGR